MTAAVAEADQLLRAGAITQAEHAAAVGLAKRAFEEAEKAGLRFGASVGFNRLQMLELTHVGRALFDQMAAGSSEGAPIRKVWGRMRLGGNVIWASKFKEWQENQVNWSPSASSGKGGGGGIVWTPSVTVVYHANLSFAVAFCEGGPGTSLGRVWADGKELDLAQYTWRFYNGSDQQLPDTFIESIEGAGNVPAYRGVCYLMFENMLLDKFGNRMPQVTAEIIRMPEVADPPRKPRGWTGAHLTSSRHSIGARPRAAVPTRPEPAQSGSDEVLENSACELRNSLRTSAAPVLVF